MFKITDICNDDYIKALIKECNKDIMKPPVLYYDEDNIVHLRFKTKKKEHIIDVIPHGNSLKKIIDMGYFCAYSKIKIKDDKYYIKYYNTNGDKVYKYEVTLCNIILNE